MNFLLSGQGMLYNLPALVLLAYLLWERPLLGTLVAFLTGVRVFGPVLGYGQWIPFSVHMTLVVVAATAYRTGGYVASLTLLFGAVVVALITTYFYFFLWGSPVVFWYGVLAGLLLRGGHAGITFSSGKPKKPWGTR